MNCFDLRCCRRNTYSECNSAVKSEVRVCQHTASDINAVSLQSAAPPLEQLDEQTFDEGREFCPRIDVASLPYRLSLHVEHLSQLEAFTTRHFAARTAAAQRLSQSADQYTIRRLLCVQSVVAASMP